MRRRPGPGARYLAACAPLIGLLMIYVPGGAASLTHLARLQHDAVHYRARVRHSAQAVAAARAALRSLEIGQPARDVRLTSVRQDPDQGLNEVFSSNWSGYADDDTGGNTYSEVSGTWAEPSISCGAQEQSSASFWVGLDGYSNGTVEQDGSLAQCDDGSVFYWTWWEMFPSEPHYVGLTVSPGDLITASVTQSGTSYKLSVSDADDSADSFTTTANCSDCANSSAEWIAEAPTSSNTILPLSDFRAWSLSEASVKSGSKTGVISTFPDDQIIMVSGSGGISAEARSLASGGSAFDVIWGTELPMMSSRVPPPGRPAGSPVPARTPPPG
jgi:hypothetical protein